MTQKEQIICTLNNPKYRYAEYIISKQKISDINSYRQTVHYLQITEILYLLSGWIIKASIPADRERLQVKSDQTDAHW